MKAAIISLAVFAVASGPARAGNNEWTGLGPDSGHVAVLAIDPQNPNTLVAGTLGGVFKTTNGGANWKPANSGLPVAAVPFCQNVVTSLAVDPRNSGTVYAGIRGQTIFLCNGGCNIPVPGGIFKSTDGRTTWNRVNSGLGAVWFFGSLAIDPRNSQNLYAISRTCGYSVTCGDGVLRSTDGGMSWSTANTGLPWPANIGSRAIDPNHPGTVYAGTNDGVYAITFLP